MNSSSSCNVRTYNEKKSLLWMLSSSSTTTTTKRMDMKLRRRRTRILCCTKRNEKIIYRLIREIGVACRRPLYNEMNLYENIERANQIHEGTLATEYIQYCKEQVHQQGEPEPIIKSESKSITTPTIISATTSTNPSKTEVSSSNQNETNDIDDTDVEMQVEKDSDVEMTTITSNDNDNNNTNNNNNDTIMQQAAPDDAAAANTNTTTTSTDTDAMTHTAREEIELEAQTEPQAVAMTVDKTNSLGSRDKITITATDNNNKSSSSSSSHAPYTASTKEFNDAKTETIVSLTGNSTSSPIPTSIPSPSTPPTPISSAVVGTTPSSSPSSASSARNKLVPVLNNKTPTTMEQAQQVGSKVGINIQVTSSSNSDISGGTSSGGVVGGKRVKIPQGNNKKSVTTTSSTTLQQKQQQNEEIKNQNNNNNNKNDGFASNTNNDNDIAANKGLGERTWQELLYEASLVVPYCTDDEYGEIVRLASILLLGFVMPYSTGGIDYYLLQNKKLTHKQKTKHNIQQSKVQQQQKRKRRLRRRRYHRNYRPTSTTTTKSENSNNKRTDAAGEDIRNIDAVDVDDDDYYYTDDEEEDDHFDVHEYIINIPFEERFEKCLTCGHRFSSSSGNSHSPYMLDATGIVEIALYEFLYYGIRPILQARTYHTHQVDLLHILAMLIHPQPLTTSTPPTTTYGSGRYPAYHKTQRLMKSLYSHQFQIMYHHRIQIIDIIVHDLTIPSFYDDNNKNNDDDDDDVNVYSTNNVITNNNSTDDEIGPLFYGSIQHLILSLKTFAVSDSQSGQDYTLAHRAIAALSSQTHNFYQYMKNDWDYILQRMADDQTMYYNGTSSTAANTSTNSKTNIMTGTTTSRNVPTLNNNNFSMEDIFTTSNDCSALSDPNTSVFCIHRARGEILASFIVRALPELVTTTTTAAAAATSSSRRRRKKTFIHGMKLFLDYARTSLTEAIEWQMDCWTSTDGDDEENNNNSIPKEHDASPALLAGLLAAAYPLFHYYYYDHQVLSVRTTTTVAIKNKQDNDDDDDEEEEEDGDNSNKIMMVDDSNDGNGSDDDDRWDTLIQCSIQLMRHSDDTIAINAARLLVLVYSNARDANVQLQNYQLIVLETVKICIVDIGATTARDGYGNRDDNDNSKVSPDSNHDARALFVGKVIAVAADRSPAITVALFHFIMKLIDRQEEEEDDEDGISTTTSANPATPSQDEVDMEDEDAIEGSSKKVLNTGLASNSADIEITKIRNRRKRYSIMTYYFKCLATVCINNPTVVLGAGKNCMEWILSYGAKIQFLTRYHDEVVTAKGRQNRSSFASQVAACILTFRLTRYFVPKQGIESDEILQRLLHLTCIDGEGPPSKSPGVKKEMSTIRTILTSANYWTPYKIAKLSLVTGNFVIAAQVYQNIADQCWTLTEKNYLWISVLNKLASAEAYLSIHGAMGIPDATIMYHTALAYLESMRSTYCNTSAANVDEKGRMLFAFQIRFILLRLDFLDLLTVLRQLTSEMRLTATGPAKFTRPHLHLTNVIRGFSWLSHRYYDIRQKYGMMFQYGGNGLQSLRLLKSLAIFVSIATKVTFCDVLSAGGGSSRSNSNNTTSSTNNPGGKPKRIPAIESFLAGHIRHPLASLLRRLYELVIQPMDTSPVNSLIRAAAMIEMIDGVLMAPFPFPSDFLIPRPTFFATLQIADDPQAQVDHQSSTIPPSSVSVSLQTTGVSDSRSLIIDAHPFICFTFCTFGVIPMQILENARVPVRIAVIWYRFVYCGSLTGIVVDEDQGGIGNVVDEGSGGDGGSGNEGDNKNTKTSNKSGGTSKDDPLAGNTGEDVVAAAAASAKPATSTIPTVPQLRSQSPVSCTLSASGRFCTSVLCPPPTMEGMFRLEVRLGCRDLTGNEWHIPVENATDDCPMSCFIRVSRSR